MVFAQAAIRTASPTPPSALHDLVRELVSLLDLFVDTLAPTTDDRDALRQVAIRRAEIACEILPGIELDRAALRTECLDLALLLASKPLITAGDLRMRTMLLATSLAGGV
jgi:hypothetical protein